jgi:hypothetical protein
MAHVNSCEETKKEIIAEACEEVGTTVRDLPDADHGKAPTVGSENEGTVSSGGDSGNSADDDALGDESSCT